MEPSEAEMTDNALASDICIACQLCCNGTIFPSISVSAREAARLEQHQPGICNGSRSELPTPCIALSSNEGCTAYHLRPNACAAFTCSLLHRATMGSLSLEKAEQIIEDMKELKKTADHASEEEAETARRALRKLTRKEFLRD